MASPNRSHRVKFPLRRYGFDADGLNSDSDYELNSDEDDENVVSEENDNESHNQNDSKLKAKC